MTQYQEIVEHIAVNNYGNNIEEGILKLYHQLMSLINIFN